MDEKDKNNYDYQYESFIIAIIIICMIYVYKSKNTKKYLYKLINEENKLKKKGIYGNIIFIIIGIILNQGFFYPYINLSTGFIFGFERGVILSYILVIISAIVGFYLSRYVFKQKFIGFMKNHDRLKYIYKGQYNLNTFQWIKSVILLRVSPISFNLCNYFFGTTNIDIFTYIISTMIGVIPWLFAEVYIGSKIKNVHKLVQKF